MRLINLDEIKCFVITDVNDEPIFRFKIGEGVPTVEAIPIEWILNHPKFPHNNEDRKKCILDMIADWRKENE